MIRDVDLVSYLPAFLARYEELEATLEAENPEFVLVWEAANRALLNSFISTADEYGISRFESLLGILPSSSNDTLESRRTRVQALWWNELPYTIRQLAAKLAEICGDDGYEIDSSQLTEYAIGITVHLYQYGEIDTLRSLVMGMIPANMVVDILNEIITTMTAGIAVAGTITGVHHIIPLSNDIDIENDTYVAPNILVAGIGECTETTEGNTGRDTDITLENAGIYESVALGVHNSALIQDIVTEDIELETQGMYTGLAMAVYNAVTLQDIVITSEDLETDTAYNALALAQSFEQGMEVAE